MEFLISFLNKLKNHKGGLADKLATEHNGILVLGHYDDEDLEFFIKIRRSNNTKAFLIALQKGEDIELVAKNLLDKFNAEAGDNRMLQALLKDFLENKND